MFRSDQERSIAIVRLLMATPKLSTLWGADGPTAEAARLHSMGGGNLSASEAVLLNVAFAVWNGDGACKITDLGALHSKNYYAALELLALAGPHPDLREQSDAKNWNDWVDGKQAKLAERKSA